MGNAVRAGLAVLMCIAIALPGPARGQPETPGIEVSPEIPVHPDVPTILELPDEIEHAQVQHRDDVMIAGAGNRLAVRPRPGTPVGAERLLEVKTRTLHRMFRLRVVARAEDAMREVVVRAAPEPAASAPEPAASALEPAASTPEPPRPPDIDHASVPEHAEPDAGIPTAAGSPRFDLAVHALLALGYTGLEVAGYGPDIAFQPHRAVGVRLTGAPRGAWWALEADVSGEWATGLMVYVAGDGSRLEVKGPLLRAELGLRVQLGTRWIPTAYAGIGVQTHLRHAESKTDIRRESMKTMQDGALLALGMGLHYRARKVLLGLEFQIRRGDPDSYRSVTAVWSLGYFLDPGE